MQNLPWQGNPLHFPFHIITNPNRVGEIVDFVIAIELIVAGVARGVTDPSDDKLAEVEFGLHEHVGDLGEGVKLGF